MIGRLAALSLLGLAACTGGPEQARPATQAASVQPAAPAPVMLRIESAQVEAARFIDAMGALRQAESQVPAHRAALIEQLQRTNPGRTEDVVWMVDEVLLPEFRMRLPELVGLMAGVLSQRLTAEELHVMRRFQEMREAGRTDLPSTQWTPEEAEVARRVATLDRAKLDAVRAELPELMGRLGAAWGTEVGTEAFRRNEERIRARGLRWTT